MTKSTISVFIVGIFAVTALLAGGMDTFDPDKIGYFVDPEESASVNPDEFGYVVDPELSASMNESINPDEIGYTVDVEQVG